MRIALIGFRATGKSTVGRILAGLLGFSFVDMDERLVAGFGESIERCVNRCGWPAFRRAEGDLLTALAPSERLVVATGGGVVLAKANRDLLTRRFRVVWLEARAATILSRLQQDPRSHALRPALTDLSPAAEVLATLREREPLYRQLAELRIDTEEFAPEAAAHSIREHLREALPAAE